MPVLYNGVSLRPAPQVSLSKQFYTTGDGRFIGTTVTARLSGQLVAQKTDDTFTPLDINSRLSALIAKQAALRAAFSEDGHIFEVQGYDGSPPVKFPAIVDSIEFPEGRWTDVSDYAITLHSAGISGEDDDGPHCESASESWTFEDGDHPWTRKAAHSVSAKGQTVYDVSGVVLKPAWQQARDFVTAKMGVDYATATDFSPASGQSLASSSNADIPSPNQWDRHITEEVNEADGTYSLTETWTLSDVGYAESYAISVKRVVEPLVTVVASISGTITGLRKSIGNNTDKYQAALAQWGTVKDLLRARCQAVAGVTLGVHPVGADVDHDVLAGTVSYQYEFNDQVYTNDAIEEYSTSRSASAEDYRTTVRVEGTITGMLYPDEAYIPPPNPVKYQRALQLWLAVEPILYARAISDSGVSGLKPFPVNAQVSPDKFKGEISYSYEFDDRDPTNVRHEYTVTKRTSREDGMDRVTVEGTITGLRQANSGSPFGTGDVAERYYNALLYWSGVSPNVLGLAAQYVSFQCVNPTPFTTQVGYNPLGGSITYSNEYTSAPTPLTPGALSEVTTVNDEDSVPVVPSIDVIGRGQGPIFQDMGTVTAKKRTLSVEIVMTPSKFGCPQPATRPVVDISAYVPQSTEIRKDQDATTWVKETGHFTRTVSWTYN